MESVLRKKTDSKEILVKMESHMAVRNWELTLPLSYVPVKAFGQTSKPVRYLIITIYTRHRVDGRRNMDTEK